MDEALQYIFVILANKLMALLLTLDKSMNAFQSWKKTHK